MRIAAFPAKIAVGRCGEWFRLHRGLTLEKALETLKSDGILHPV